MEDFGKQITVCSWNWTIVLANPELENLTDEYSCVFLNPQEKVFMFKIIALLQRGMKMEQSQILSTLKVLQVLWFSDQRSVVTAKLPCLTSSRIRTLVCLYIGPTKTAHTRFLYNLELPWICSTFYSYACMRHSCK